MDAYETSLRAAMRHLQTVDPALGPIIKTAGLPTVRPHANYFDELVRAIIAQQVSSKAAAVIYGRFIDLFEGKLSAAEVAGKDEDFIRQAGVSGVKSRYILDLAQRAHDGRLNLVKLPGQPDEAVIIELTAVKGIGVWTAQVFMLFCLGRLDVLVPGDLGIRSGVKKLCGLDELPTPAEVETIAESRGWAPYRSVACWYLWRLLDDNLYLYDKR